MSKDTSEGAFPVYSPDSGTQSGMTLRDYFAGQAMKELRYDSVHYGTTRTDPVALAQYCYEIADAMIAERAK